MPLERARWAPWAFSLSRLVRLTIEEFQNEAKLIARNMAVVGVAMLISNVIIVGSLGMSATKQSFRIRHNFMRAMLHQEIGWFDTHTTGDFASRITA